MEEWKDIKDYEGLYQVSNMGNVKSLKFGKERILKYKINKYGYYLVCLCNKGVKKFHTIHRLVAESFIPNPDNKNEIDHINTDKADNRVENLRWVTHIENMNNSLSIDKRYKSVLQFSLNGDIINKWDSVKEANEELNIGSHITSCCVGKRKTAYGYIWRYYDLELYLESKLFKAFNIKNKLVA